LDILSIFATIERKGKTMEFIIVFLVAIVLVAIAFVGLAISVLIKKKGKFPNIHIGSNKHMRDRGITCAQTYDKMEQAKAKGKFGFKELSIIRDAGKSSC
jgi:hypothetical protein